MLLLATLFWGLSFVWAKSAVVAIDERAGLPAGAIVGPLFCLAVRFGLAAALMVLFIPAARRGWTRKTVRHSLVVGSLLASSMLIQLIGLDRTSEAVSAFLTSLTVLFVPIILTIVYRRPPRPILWVGVGLAIVGIALMTAPAAGGYPGIGELLGIVCAVAFSAYILAVNAAASEDAWRLSLGQFAVTAILCGLACAAFSGTFRHASPRLLLSVLKPPGAWLNLLLLALFPTLGAFGILTHYQPKIEPTRATLIYLMEPVVAAVYAALAAHHGLSPVATGGAVLILLANMLVETLSAGAAPSAPG